MLSRISISRACLFVCEPVEGRRLLSASLSAGKLTILGTGVADLVSLQVVNGGSTLRVVDNGIESDFSYAAVTSINVSLSAGADTFLGSDAVNRPTSLTGSSGNDTLFGNGGNDVIWGNADNDTLDGRAGKDTISGSDGLDSIRGGSGADSLNGGNDADTLWSFRNVGGEANNDNGDVVNGGEGNDTLNGSGGQDTLNGDGGNDVIDTAKFWDFHAPGKDSVTGGEGNDTVYGQNEQGVPTTIRGGNGNDSIFGGNGPDLIYGDGGLDTIEGNAGKDTIYGGEGNDKLSVNGIYPAFNAAETDSVFGEGGDDDIFVGPVGVGRGGIGNDTLRGRFSVLFGDDGSDYLVSTGNATLWGGNNNDDLVLGGNTVAYGEEGDDYLFSSSNGTDTLNGGNGFDRGVNVKRTGSPLDGFSSIERFIDSI